jgi:hypothetical protein
MNDAPGRSRYAAACRDHAWINFPQESLARAMEFVYRKTHELCDAKECLSRQPVLLLCARFYWHSELIDRLL